MGIAKGKRKLKNPPVLSVADMRDLLTSWGIAMRGQRTPAWTVSQYERGARYYLDWCEANGAAADLSDPGAARRWLASLAADGQAANTINARLSAIRAWARWLLEQDEIGASGLGKVAWAKPDERIPPYITPDQQAAILRACAGSRWLDLRDAALFGTMFDGLLRADEACSVLTADIDARKRTTRVRRGKGGKERVTAFSPETAARVDRYARARKRHRFAEDPHFWLSQKGPLSYSGLYGAFKRRAAAAGIEAHPHMLRAGGAVQWRRKGGSVTGLMTVAGWKSVAMVDLYTRAAETELAIAEAHRLHERR